MDVLSNDGFKLDSHKLLLRLFHLISAISVLANFAVPCLAQETPVVLWCKLGNGMPCSSDDLRDPIHNKQILVLPAGFQKDEYALFRSEFDRLVNDMTFAPGTSYSSRYRNQIVYIGYWMAGDKLGTANSLFGSAVRINPFRGKALSLRLDDVISIADFVSEYLMPVNNLWVTAVLFNTLEEGITANASPPSFLGKNYGISKLTRSQIGGHYISSHEIAHGGLNFLDEYTEQGFESMTIRLLDYLTPFLLIQTNWSQWQQALNSLFGIFDYHISEILAANGNDNIDVTPYPSRVSTAGYNVNPYEYEGGMFFGLGTFRDAGKNLMNGDRARQFADEGFAFAHSFSQEEVIAQAFDHPHFASRPNDRIRNAGPLDGWKLAFGSTTHIMLYDGDKNHHYHPTASYDVQVGWYDRKWKVCWAAIIPYPCYDQVWTTAQKSLRAVKHTVALKTSMLYGLTGVVQKVICALGLGKIPYNGQKLDICGLDLERLSTDFLPTLNFPMPYQDLDVPASQWFTTYYWRFRTENQTLKSGWTSWASFFRSL